VLDVLLRLRAAYHHAHLDRPELDAIDAPSVLEEVATLKRAVPEHVSATELGFYGPMGPQRGHTMMPVEPHGCCTAAKPCVAGAPASCPREPSRELRRRALALEWALLEERSDAPPDCLKCRRGACAEPGHDGLRHYLEHAPEADELPEVRGAIEAAKRRWGVP
jgi:hypothetical protein